MCSGAGVEILSQLTHLRFKKEKEYTEKLI